MVLYYFCTESECGRKFVTKEKLISHYTDKHHKQLENDPQPTDLSKEPKTFYLCGELDCNKKFKIKEKLINHALEVHNKILDNVPDPIPITKDNKKAEEKKKNELKRLELLEEKKKEIERMKELEMIAKKEIEEKYKQEQIEKYKLIEEEKIKQEQQLLQQQIKLLELESKWMDMINKVQTNYCEDSELCSICFVDNADTAIVPCGHKYFCYNCISDYNKTYPNKGCPICRKHVTSLVKIFSA
ncbi:zinc finger C2H2-type protein [Fadolivirus algeromassiliense]|jgi:hypothetical protein|uniref:Zinc finger C2H2-type protein n=1 Tax=Fadolivirus FV1/VV64 TaxID=3070911 RepID=A0A7D3UQZ8_9VIRU|nr:zinc finger C2H2-type protein [Fadolivirus algeromassiliense]QKF94868.1 zinc finger C2H2-type protein [Fadolivirus FV1/VV64]